MRHACIAILATIFSISCMAQKVDNRPVGALNLDRYLGNWYEIARMDHGFERGVTYAKARYVLMDDGHISVINSGLKNGKTKISQGKAKTTDTAGLLRVSFFGPFYSDYRVLMLDDDYQFALVGSKSADYLWILSRTPQMAAPELQSVISEARRRGYDTDKLIWVQQSDQLK